MNNLIDHLVLPKDTKESAIVTEVTTPRKRDGQKHSSFPVPFIRIKRSFQKYRPLFLAFDNLYLSTVQRSIKFISYVLLR